MPEPHFSPELFRFLTQLARNNDREWFAENKAWYERDVRDPLLRFIGDVAAPLRAISVTITADPRPSGGSMFRIYRDTRFSKSKTPYKTHASAQFRHLGHRDAHGPCFYLHLEPNKVFGGAGIWRPDGPSVQAIRQAIIENATLWKKITRSRGLRSQAAFGGDSLKRPPRGFDANHPLVEDLKRKDFLVVTNWTEADAVKSDFLKRFVRFAKTVGPYNEFLARSLELDW
jgi:uncharacterized protein (TIGR02453 family)